MSREIAKIQNPIGGWPLIILSNDLFIVYYEEMWRCDHKHSVEWNLHCDTIINKKTGWQKKTTIKNNTSTHEVSLSGIQYKGVTRTAASTSHRKESSRFQSSSRLFHFAQVIKCKRTSWKWIDQKEKFVLVMYVHHLNVKLGDFKCLPAWRKKVGKM